MIKLGRTFLLALLGIGVTAAAYSAALSAMPWVDELTLKQSTSHWTQSTFWDSVEAGALVFLCCLFGGLVQAAILILSRSARPVIAIATILGSAAAWSLQVYAYEVR